MSTNFDAQKFVQSFRDSAPYIRAFRGRTFVLAFGGEVVADGAFPALAHDIALLSSLGVRLVLVHGIRPQVEASLRRRGATPRCVAGLRVTDALALECVKEAAGAVGVEIEALLSMGVTNSPMAGARMRVVAGNFVTARPLGVRDGVDFGYTGEVRRVDTQALGDQLRAGACVLVSPLGFSPTGEVFNLRLEEVASAVAGALQADKLLYLIDGAGVRDEQGRLLHEIVVGRVASEMPSTPALDGALAACRAGVRRSHLIDRHRDGALLLELFTRDGVGTMVSEDAYDGTRAATIDDVGGILALVEPLEARGLLVRRSRERLETEIDRFVVMERDGAIIGCAALYPLAGTGLAEIACLVTHPDYAGQGRGRNLLYYMERDARRTGIRSVFVLTTRTGQWFQEQGFRAVPIEELPVERQVLYNYQRQSKVMIKTLEGNRRLNATGGGA